MSSKDPPPGEPAGAPTEQPAESQPLVDDNANTTKDTDSHLVDKDESHYDIPQVKNKKDDTADSEKRKDILRPKKNFLDKKKKKKEGDAGSRRSEVVQVGTQGQTQKTFLE